MMPRVVRARLGGADAPLGFLWPVAFLAGIEARAHENAGRTEHHHRRQPAAVADAAGGHHRHAAGREIDNRRHDVDGGAGRAMAAGLGALRHQNVGAGIQRLLSHGFILNLTDQQRSRLLDAGRKWFGIAERQHDRARPCGQRDIQQVGLLRQTPGDEADAERRRLLLEFFRLLLEPASFAIAAAENSKTAGAAHRCRQPRAGNHIHRRQQHRMPDAQQASQWGLDRHFRSPVLDSQSTSGYHSG